MPTGKRGKYTAMSSSADLAYEYTPDQIEFMMAMERYMRERRRPYPDCRDVLVVVKELGYEKQSVEG